MFEISGLSTICKTVRGVKKLKEKEELVNISGGWRYICSAQKEKPSGSWDIVQREV